MTKPSRASVKIELPEHAVLWACMGVSSWTTKHGGAVRLYYLFRTLDPNGSGHMPAKHLKAAALQLGVRSRTFYAWLADALQAGIFEKLFDGETLRVRSQQEVLRIVGGRDVDKTRVSIPLKSLFKNGWRSIIWAGYLKANWSRPEVNSQGEPVTVYKTISQKKLEAITGVGVSAQKNTLHKHYKSVQQIGITNEPADKVTMLNEYASTGKYFKFIDPQQGNNAVAGVHLPSEKRVSNKTARTATRGRRRAILAHLQRHGLACLSLPLSNIRQADNRVVTRLFYSTPNTQGMTPEQAGRAVKKYEKTVIRIMECQPLPGDPNEVFIRRGKRHAWDVVPFGMCAKK